MKNLKHNLLVVLGPTASGKTRLGARLAHRFGGEVVSADSRQVYRGLNIGAGKDLADYEVDGVAVPHHLIDIVDLDVEFSVFDYQKRCYHVIEALWQRDMLPVLVGGTGLYIESVLRGYRMVEAPENPVLRAELAELPLKGLAARLYGLREKVHNVTDLRDRDRLVRAIEIAEHAKTHEAEPSPEIRPLILGTRWDRETLRGRIHTRLLHRFNEGMIDEVQALHNQGVSWEKLDFLGLEYRYIGQFLQGAIKNQNDLVQKLSSAICQFAKRQETWFRRMERNGTAIHWIDEADYDAAAKVVAKSGITTG